ncbi:hypothetical protein BGZ58_003462 [Dissophora ornata]|nr:hypothetical protein BGZ58_003462 [Dissophora ornata]
MDRTAASDEERAANKNGNSVSTRPSSDRRRRSGCVADPKLQEDSRVSTTGFPERKAQALSSGSVCRSSTKEPGPKYLGYTLPPRLFPTLQYGRRTKFHKPSLDGALKQVSSDGGHSTPASRPVESKVRSAEPSALEGTSAAPVVIDTAISAAGAGAGAGSAAAAKTLSD